MNIISDPSFLEKALYKFYYPQTKLGKLLRYGWIRRLSLEVKDVNCKFDTTSDIAFDWFFPRYANGVKHEQPVMRLMLRYLNPGSVFFDIGANLGVFTVFAASVGHESNVHAFEMDPELIGEINKNCAINSLKNVRTICAAVTDCSDDVACFKPHSGDLENKSQNQIRSQGTGKDCVSTLALDDYCHQFKLSPDVVKIDVEGAEHQVLAGMEGVLTEAKPVLFMEVHFRHLEKFDSSLETILELLNTADYEVRALADHRDPERPAETRSLESADLSDNPMLICQPE